MNIKHMKMARKVSQRWRTAYRAQGALEKVVGKILTRTLGIPDAPESFFKEVTKKVEATLEEAGMPMDLNDPEIYPYLHRIIIDEASSNKLF